MKGHKEHHHRKHREAGGVNDAEKDLDTKPANRSGPDKKINDEAEERKHGGRTHRKHGGEVHHKDCKCHKCMGGEAKKERKEGGKVEGEHEKHRADRKPRKSGGSANATEHPFSSAREGTAAEGRKIEKFME